MNNLFEKFFGTPGKMLVTVLIAAVVVATLQGVGNIKVALNEDQAAGLPVALDLNTANAQIAGQCYGANHPRIFLSWPAINGVVQKQTGNGYWTKLLDANHKTFKTDWDVTPGETYLYRIKKSPKVFSNIIKIRPTAKGCTVTPIASAATIAVPGHIAPFYNNETIRLSVVGEPNRPVQLCYKFTSDTSKEVATTICTPTTQSFSTKTTTDGTWSQDISFRTGSVVAWFIAGGAKSNELRFSVILPPDAPTGLTTTPGSLACDHSYNPLIMLSWNAVPGAVTYNIQQSETPGGPYTSVSSGVQGGVTGTSFQSGPLTPPYTYYYVVTSVDQYGTESAYSNEVEANIVVEDCQLTGVLTTDFSDPNYTTNYALTVGDQIIPLFISADATIIDAAGTAHMIDDLESDMTIEVNGKTNSNYPGAWNINYIKIL